VNIFVGLFLLFTGLKLTGYIDWSWWFVTAPIWGGFVVLLVVFAFAAANADVRR